MRESMVRLSYPSKPKKQLRGCFILFWVKMGGNPKDPTEDPQEDPPEDPPGPQAQNGKNETPYPP